MKLFTKKLLVIVIFYLFGTAFSTETDSTNLNGIFGSFRMMMSKLEKTNNKETSQKNTLSPPPVTLADVAGNNIANQIEKEIDPVMASIKLGPPPFFSGWVQYFKYTTDRGLEKPTEFFKNMQFYKQMKKYPKADLKEKDSDKKYKYIRKDTYFYATLFETTLNFASSKQVLCLLFYLIYLYYIFINLFCILFFFNY